MLIALVLSCIAVGPAMAADFGDPDTLQDPYADLLPVDLISVDDSVKQATPYWCLLTAKDESKLKYLDTIDRYPKISEADKESIKSALKVMWEKYPMKYSKVPNDHGSVTYIGFADEASDFEITDEEQELLKLVEYILAEMRETSPQVQWNYDGHEAFINESASKFRMPKQYIEIAKSSSKQPDDWKVMPIPDSVYTALYPLTGWSQIKIKDTINALFHSYSHAYDPKFFGGCGSAPDETKKYADFAYNYYKNDQFENAARNLGYASHFLTDVGNPLHSGKFLEQMLDYELVGKDMSKTVHGRYENYVSANWNDFEPFLKTDTALGNRNWAEGCKSLAELSHIDSDTIYREVHDSTNDELIANTNTNLKRCTINRVKMTAKYTNGLVMYVMKG